MVKMFGGSQMRKRSRDARATSQVVEDDFDTADFNSTDRTTAAGKPVVAFVLVLVLLSIVVLLVCFGNGSVRPLSPWKVDLGPTAQDVDNQDPFRLRPENHIFRKPDTLRQSWRVTTGLRRPDGVLKKVYLINDQFPGPTIEARPGDRIVIEVENALEEETLSIHWHGLSMRGANNMDGAVGITNEPLAPGAALTYDFCIDDNQHGTFFYHSHDGLQRAEGLYGAFIVHDAGRNSRKANARSKHRLLMIGDWYHRTGDDAMDFYAHPGSFGNEAVPDSMLLNGIGAFNCSNAVPARPLDCQQRSLKALTDFGLDGRRDNILHVINVGTYAGVSIAIPGSVLTAFAVDGGNAIASEHANSIGYIQPGERVDIRVMPIEDAASQDTALEIAFDTTPFKYPNPALTPTHHWPVRWEHGPQGGSMHANNLVDFFDLSNAISARTEDLTLPATADETIVLYAMTQRLAHLENAPRGFINNTSWRPQFPALISSPRNLWNKDQFVHHIKHSRNIPLWIDIVLNNLDEDNHPFHLHGNDFWVLSTYSSKFNWGSYNPYEDDEPPGGPYDPIHPIKKDTVNVPRRGYAVLRFRADNPGLWLFHCHVLWHQASGMAMTFEVGP